MIPRPQISSIPFAIAMFLEVMPRFSTSRRDSAQCGRVLYISKHGESQRNTVTDIRGSCKISSGPLVLWSRTGADNVLSTSCVLPVALRRADSSLSLQKTRVIVSSCLGHDHKCSEACSKSSGCPVWHDCRINIATSLAQSCESFR